MTKNNILNIENLLQPISTDAPCGVNLQNDEIAAVHYFHLRDVRNHARTLERKLQQGLENSEKPDWLNVHKLSLELLTKYSKDLEVASYLVESLQRLHGFIGLGYGFQFIHQLINLYWDDLYPHPDEDGISTKVLPLANLNGFDNDGTLIIPLALAPLTDSNSQESYALWHYQQAQQSPQQLEIIYQAAQAAPKHFYLTLAEEITFCLDQFKDLNNLLDQLCGSDAPPSSRLMAKLNDCLDCVKDIARLHLEQPVEVIPEEPVHEIVETAPVKITMDSHQNRQAMLNNISQASAYFRKMEPHSPISYLLDKAVKWGQMSLPELLQEMIDNEDVKVKIASITGIELAPPN